MSARIAVPVFPGTNSEDETVRLLRDCGGNADLVHWSHGDRLAEYDAYVLSGGFAYEDRIRAGAIAAHDRIMDFVIDGAASGKLVFGICNGAQILLEAGLVPGTGPRRRPTAAFAKNGPQPHFVCRHVQLKLAIAPSRCAITAGLPPGALVPAWAAHAEGRLAATPQHLDEIVVGDHLAFLYAHADGTVDDAAVPNGSALHCAGLVNREGNVLAIMPHPERDGWNFNHLDRADGDDVLAPSGGAVLFRSFVHAVALRTP
ncbi:MAG: phosphoribosylformylglycinamidine synthase I [Candidatus Eremiobacteraeota bacterium]|nr:phosphoribosylformylglycinamidine synthase I [Candidatus Eremiobacteraeota bacterium]